MGIHPAIQEYAAAVAMKLRWEDANTRIPYWVYQRVTIATKAVLELQDQLTEDLPTNGIGRI